MVLGIIDEVNQCKASVNEDNEYRCFIEKLLKDKSNWTLDDVHVYDYLAANKLDEEENVVITEFNKVLHDMRQERIRQATAKPHRTLMEICCRCKAEGTRLRINDETAYCEDCICAMDKQKKNRDKNHPVAIYEFCYLCGEDAVPLQRKTSDKPYWHKECGGDYLCSDCRQRCHLESYVIKTKRCHDCQTTFDKNYMQLKKKKDEKKHTVRLLYPRGQEEDPIINLPEAIGRLTHQSDKEALYEKYRYNAICARCGDVASRLKSTINEEVSYCIECARSLDYKFKDERKLGTAYTFCGICHFVDDQHKLSEEERLEYDTKICTRCPLLHCKCKKHVWDVWCTYNNPCDDCYYKHKRSTAPYVYHIEKDNCGSNISARVVKVIYTTSFALTW